MNGISEVRAYADYVNLLKEIIYIIKKNQENFLLS
jgi:hypothetical protein